MVAEAHSAREELEHALVLDLKKLPYLRAVRLYEGELGGGDDLDEIRDVLNGLAPGILVATGDESSSVSAGSRKAKRMTEELDISLIVATRSLRGRVEQRHGEVGYYRILQDLKSRFAGWVPPVQRVGSLVYRGARNILQEPDIGGWRVMFGVTIDFASVDRDEEFAPGIESIGGSANIVELVLASGFGNSLIFAHPTITLTDPAMASTALWVGLRVRISGALNPANNGDFPVTARLNATQIQFTNKAGTPEQSEFLWQLLGPPGALLDTEVA